MSDIPQVSAPAEGEFPDGPTVRGRYYMTDSPMGERIVIMSYETWGDFGTTLESLRRVAKAQDTRIKELLAAAAASDLAKADAEKRLEALRDIRREEKRKDIEDGPRIIVPQRNIQKGR